MLARHLHYTVGASPQGGCHTKVCNAYLLPLINYLESRQGRQPWLEMSRRRPAGAPPAQVTQLPDLAATWVGSVGSQRGHCTIQLVGWINAKEITLVLFFLHPSPF